MDMNEFFYSANYAPSYIVVSESGRAHYGRRPRVVELVVPMCCSKCEEKVRENMLEVEGVQGVLVDPRTQRVTVTGFVDPLRTLKKARKVKKDSQLLSGDHLHRGLEYSTSSSTKHRRSEYNVVQPSTYHGTAASSSRFVEHRPPTTSYNRLQYTPSYAGTHIVHGTIYDDVDSHVITNPRYVKHIESDQYWH